MPGPIFYFSVVASMHLFGVLIFVTYVSGIEYILMTPLIALACWAYMIIEMIGVAIMSLVYKKQDTQCLLKGFVYGVLFCLVAGAIMETINPLQNEDRFVGAGFWSGFGATALSFYCLHVRKVCQLRKITETEVS